MIFIVVFLIIAAFFAVLFSVSVIIEKRQFRNGVFLLMIIINLLLAGLDSSGEIGSVAIDDIAAAIIMLVFTAFLILSILLIINGFIVARKEGFSKTALVSPAVGLAIIVFFGAACAFVIHTNEPVLISVMFLFIVMELFYVGFTLLSFFLYSLFYMLLPKKVRCDYIIVNGAGLLDGDRISPLLAGRLDKALEVYEKSGRKAKFLVSGGKGNDETVSEAEAMKNYLLQQGISKDDILTEDKSKTTYENLKFSKRIIDELNPGKRCRCLFVTSNYHVFRTSMFAKKLHLKAEGVGCKTAHYYWPSAFLREYIAVFVKYKWFFVAWTVLTAALLCIAYIFSQLNS